MAARQYGKLQKQAVESHISVIQFDPDDSDSIGDELNEPIAPETDEEADPELTLIVDEILLGYDFGNGIRPDETPLSPDRDNPLIVDIDDGRSAPAQNRLGALKRVDTSTRSYSKFNRHTGAWE